MVNVKEAKIQKEAKSQWTRYAGAKAWRVVMVQRFSANLTLHRTMNSGQLVQLKYETKKQHRSTIVKQKLSKTYRNSIIFLHKDLLDKNWFYLKYYSTFSKACNYIWLCLLLLESHWIKILVFRFHFPQVYWRYSCTSENEPINAKENGTLNLPSKATGLLQTLGGEKKHLSPHFLILFCDQYRHMFHTTI